MADKEINFKIKFDNKELDLTKISFEQFDSIVKKAKTDLSNLKVGSPEYKKAEGDINNLENSWKKLIKTQQEEDEQTKKNTEDVKSYTAQIKALTLANIQLENQGQKNSQAYEENKAKIKSLRDEQEAMQRSTQKLDDALSNIPGPIGQIGSSMQQLESVSGSAKSAMDSLGLGFKGVDQIAKTTFIGVLVGLLVTLVAAVMDSAKSFKPLQDAFALIGDAVGSLFEALKPLTDFILNVFVGAIKVVSGIISFFADGIAALSGRIDEVNSKKILKQQTLELERDLEKIEQLLSFNTAFMNKYFQDQLNLRKDYDTKLAAINKKAYDDEKQRLKDIQQLGKDNFLAGVKLEFDEKLRIRQHNADLLLQTELTNAQQISNDDKRNKEIAKANLKHDNELIAAKRDYGLSLALTIQGNYMDENKLDENQKKIVKQSIDDNLQIYNEGQTEIDQKTKTFNAEQNRTANEQARENSRIVAENGVKTQELKDSLIKKEVDRNVKLAEDAKKTLQNNHLNELEDIRLKQGEKSQVYKSAIERQAQEIKVEDEKIRQAKLVQSEQEVQDEINKQERILKEVNVGTEQYFQTKRNIINLNLQKEMLIADGDRQKELDAQSNQYKALKELDKEQLDQRILLQQTYFSTLIEGTDKYYQAQRDLENLNYQKAYKDAEGNYELQEQLKKQHEVNMGLIDNSQLENSATLAQRHADTQMKLFGSYYKDQRDAEEKFYQERVKAAGDNNALIKILDEEHLKNKENSIKEEVQMYGDLASKVASGFSDILGAQASALDEEAKTSESAFNKRKEFQLQSAKMGAASAIISILAGTGTGNFIVDAILKGLAIGAVIVKTNTQIKNIENTKFQGGTTGGGGIMTTKGMADGGYIDGPRHSQGGVNINAEGGEAVMTRGAVSMFGPMLSMMNQMGGGVGFNMGNIQGIRPDNPKTSTNNDQTVIKTYVVEGELTSTQQKQSRLKDLSTL